MRELMRPAIMAGLLAAMALPATAANDEPARTRPSTLEGSALTWCGDVETVQPDPSLFADSPVYVSNEQPTEKVRRWARQQPGFADLWIDRDHRGWLVVAFTQDADLRQAEIEQRFAEDGVVAVGVEHTTRELRKLQDRIGKRLSKTTDSWASGADVTANVVEIQVPYLTRKIVRTLERSFSGEPFCIDGSDPSARPTAGPQPTEGEGWSLVGYEHALGKSYRTGVASDAAEIQRLWRRSGVAGDVPEVDFTQNVAMWFAIGHGSTCDNLRLDEVVIDHDASVVYPRIVDLDGHIGCTDDLTGAYQYVVALDRARLPVGPFVVQTGPPQDYDGAPDQTFVDVDLSIPGSTAAAGQIHAAPKDVTPAMRSGAFVEPFGAWDYVLESSCPGYLGEINDIHWVSELTEVPEAWRSSVELDGDLLVSIALRAKPEPHVDATLNGLTERYLPGATDAASRCDT
jgi:hypothetical protein